MKRPISGLLAHLALLKSTSGLPVKSPATALQANSVVGHKPSKWIASGSPRIRAQSGRPVYGSDIVLNALVYPCARGIIFRRIRDRSSRPQFGRHMGISGHCLMPGGSVQPAWKLWRRKKPPTAEQAALLVPPRWHSSRMHTAVRDYSKPTEA